ncbi:hypothetical protein BDZ97DRAFT_1780843 [Flammula alnicola]|nr:hypothetical protein BDZ97DRAFT_1780843 [Flammula alnicola]
MRHSKETTIHELYLRASSATKKTAPLKLYANVVGKFAVERELADELRDKIRESTQDAANQRNTRTTVFMETPPDLPSNSRKRKEPPSSSSMFRKPLRPSDKLKPAPVASTTVPLNKPPAASTPGQRDDPVPLRKRVVQCLAVSERTEEQIVKLVGGSDRSPSIRRDVQDLLEQVAEPTAGKASSADKSPRIYRLIPMAWKEVRPYEWPMLNESERRTMARSARIALQNLGIPESDPVWNHVRYRSPGSMNPSTSQHTSSSEQSKSSASGISEDASRSKAQDVPPKRGMSSRETKEKNKKPKPDPKAEIMMKNESLKASDTIRTNLPDRRPNEPIRTNPPDNRRNDATQHRRATDYNEMAPARRQPAHDPKAMKSNGRQVALDDLQASTSSNKSHSGRQVEREVAPSGSANKSAHSQGEERSLASQRIKKIRRETFAGASDSEKEKHSTQGDRIKAKNKISRKDIEDNPRDDTRVSASKRKVVDHEHDDFEDVKARSMAQKRRKTEPLPVPTQSFSRDERTKDVTPIKRSDHGTRPQNKPIPRNPTSVPSSSKARHDSPAVKRNASSNPNGRISPNSPLSSSLPPSNSNSQSRKSNSAKPRRRSPIYTSSEEEDEDTPLSTRLSASAPVTTPSHATRDSSSRNLPTDHATLRARYNTSYLEYLTSFQRLVIQKGKLDNMLKSNDLGSVGSITDSEGDIELMDPEELAQLTTNHRKLREELESIQQVFGRTTRNGEPLPAPDLLTV